jgi:hypothetical protein
MCPCVHESPWGCGSIVVCGNGDSEARLPTPRHRVVRFGDNRTCRTFVALSQFFSVADGKDGEAIVSCIVLARNMRDGKIEFACQLATNPI